MPKPRRITLPLPRMPDDRSIADKLRAKLAGELAGPAVDVETKKRDLRERIQALKAQLRGGPLTVMVGGRSEVTAEGHISNAVTLLTRELERL